MSRAQEVIAMKRAVRVAPWLLLAALLAAQSQKKTESFWAKLLRISGVSATPSSLRGEDRVASGDIWWVMVTRKTAPQRITRGGEYNSPVFDSKGENILALRGGDLYRVPVDGDPPIKLHSLTGVSKLVGVSRDDPDQLLVIAQDAQHLPSAAFLSIRAGTLVRIPHNPLSNEDKVMLAHLTGWERDYGNTRLYTEKNEKEGVGGTIIEFSDVYVKRAGDPPINLTNGNSVSSSQPSLSADGQRVVFIRGER
jgi:hypothetical protein